MEKILLALIHSIPKICLQRYRTHPWKKIIPVVFWKFCPSNYIAKLLIGRKKKWRPRFNAKFYLTWILSNQPLIVAIYSDSWTCQKIITYMIPLYKKCAEFTESAGRKSSTMKNVLKFCLLLVVFKPKIGLGCDLLLSTNP